MTNDTKNTLKLSLGDVYRLAGPHNKKIRQFIMSDLCNKKIPAAKSGVNALQSKLFEVFNIKKDNYCTMHKELSSIIMAL